MEIDTVKEILKRKKMGYAELSEISGVPLPTIKRLLCGRTKNPRVETVYAIERALGIREAEGSGDMAVPYMTEDEEKIIKKYRKLCESDRKYLLLFLDGLSGQAGK